VLLVIGRGDIVVLPVVTAVLLHLTVMDAGTDSIVVSAG